MARTWTTRLAEGLEWSQDSVVTSLVKTDPDLVRQRPASTAPSIGFHAWHLARWADRHAAALAGWLDATEPPADIWQTEAVAEAWGFGMDLGEFGIGAGLDDDASAALPLPDVDVLAGYVRAAFAAARAVIGRLDDDRLDQRVVDLYGDEVTIAEVILGLASHTDRHLGMMEAIRGVLGEHGTATS